MPRDLFEDVEFGPDFKVSLKAYTRPDGDHPIYAAVGNIAAEWAYFEHQLDEVIGTIVNIDSTKRACLTAQMMGASPRYNAIAALLDLEDKNPLRKETKPSPRDLVSKINRLQTKTYEVSERRNRIVHDPWFIEVGSDQPTQFRSMPKKDLTYGMKGIDQGFLQETYEKIADLIKEVAKFRLVLRDALASWHGKPPPPPLPIRDETAESKEILKVLLARLDASKG